MRLAGKVAIVTGGGTGIGRACVERFAAEGAAVVIASRDADVAHSVEELVRSRAQKCLFVQTDVGEPEQVRHVIERTVAEFGKLDILYNNAGGSTAQDGPLDAIDFAEFWNKMRVDLFGTWLGCHYAIPTCGLRAAARSSMPLRSAQSSEQPEGTPIRPRKAQSRRSPVRWQSNMHLTGSASMRLPQA